MSLAIFSANAASGISASIAASSASATAFQRGAIVIACKTRKEACARTPGVPGLPPSPFVGPGSAEYGGGGAGGGSGAPPPPVVLRPSPAPGSPGEPAVPRR